MAKLHSPLWLIVSITVLVLSVSPAAAKDVGVIIPGVSGESGQDIQIPVMIDEVENLAGVKLVMTYDPELLKFQEAVKTEKTTSLMHIANDKKPGLLIVVMAGPQGIKGRNFPILSLVFKAKENLAGNHTTRITISEAQLMSDQLQDLSYRVDIQPTKILPSKKTPKTAGKNDKKP